MSLPTPFSIELGILANTNTLLDWLGSLISKVKEIRNFRPDCAELVNTCISLSYTFLENKESLDGVRSGSEFRKCLAEVAILVAECGSWDYMHIGWEVTWEKKVAKAEKNLEACRKTFETDLLINIKADHNKTIGALQKMQSDLHSFTEKTMGGHNSEREKFLKRISELEVDLERSRREALSLRPHSGSLLKPVTLSDESLTVTKYDGQKPQLGTQNGTPIVFERILRSTHPDLYRLGNLYEQIGNIALVQKLVAIAEVDQTKYALMEDMAEHTSLSKAIENPKFGSYSLPQKLQFAYELAATVSALHRSNILIKVISDETVYIQAFQTRIRPKLTNLKNAREIWELTSNDQQDVRFEAPELQTAGIHTTMTDMWSVGILLLEFFNGQHPYKTKPGEGDNSSKEQIRKGIHSGKWPFDNIPDTSSLPHILAIKKCLQATPLRPTASSLAQDLLECLIVESSKDTGFELTSIKNRSNATEIDSSVQKVLERISGAKKLAKERKAEPSKETNRLEKFPKLVLGELLQLQSESHGPAIDFVIGSGYLWDVFHTDDDDPTLGSLTSVKAECAKRAEPFLRAAADQGYTLANRELFEAHKRLAAYYQEICKSSHE